MALHPKYGISKILFGCCLAINKPIADETGNDRWESVSSHDLRRSWATYHLVERQVDVRTMMAIGGWSDYSAIEPYLTEPTERRIGDAMRTK